MNLGINWAGVWVYLIPKLVPGSAVAGRAAAGFWSGEKRPLAGTGVQTRKRLFSMCLCLSVALIRRQLKFMLNNAESSTL